MNTNIHNIQYTACEKNSQVGRLCLVSLMSNIKKRTTTANSTGTVSMPWAGVTVKRRCCQLSPKAQNVWEQLTGIGFVEMLNHVRPHDIILSVSLIWGWNRYVVLLLNVLFCWNIKSTIDLQTLYKLVKIRQTNQTCIFKSVFVKLMLFWSGRLDSFYSF